MPTPYMPTPSKTPTPSRFGTQILPKRLLKKAISARFRERILLRLREQILSRTPLIRSQKRCEPAAFEVAKTKDQVAWRKCIADFIEKNGNFAVKILKNPDLGNRGGEQILPQLTVKRDPGSSKSLQDLKDYFKCGVVRKNNRTYRIRSVKDLKHKVVPFFETEEFHSHPQKRNFQGLREVVEIMGEREHLTVEGFQKIKGIVADLSERKP